MKSLQFRSIAPKAPTVVPSPSPAVLSCQPPTALPEATTASSPKSIIVPTQNYALMQIAGQDGTFSLVALPPSVSSQTPQQQQQQTQSIQKNLKLPIPRYQPVRSKGTRDKVKSPPLAARVKTASKVAVTAQTKSVGCGASTVTKKKQLESKHTIETTVPKEESSEKLIMIDSASSDISVTALLPDNAVLYPGSQLERTPDSSERPATTSLIQNLQFPPAAIKSSPCKTPEESKTTVRLCQSKPSAAQPQITVLSPAIFSKAVQIIPTPPKGKLPILPYSKMKSTLIPAAKLSDLSPEKKGFSRQTRLTSPLDPTSKTLETAEALGHIQVPDSTLQSKEKTAVMPVLGTLQKPPGKKRGRKRKTMEDILAFEARKKRSLSFFRRRVPEKPLSVIPGSKQKEVDISKKYRSIRPKPMLVMETVPQLVSLPAINPDGQDQELVLGHQLPTTTATKALDCPPQPASVTLHLRGASHPRVFIGSRTLYRCPTCSRCFQFKHHLQSHMNSHTNSRPYVCPVCRKAYAHSGSLSTHMKLHHSEVRPRRSLSCEFCEKSFGYVGVYFSHLREVHKVVLTVEPSISHHEDDVSVEGVNSPEPSDEQDHEDPVELQIKCGRCHAITPTFADMKMHLLYVHGEEVQVRLHDSQHSQGGREAEKELVKHAAHYWRQLNEKRSPVKCGSCDEEFFSFSKLKKHIISHHHGREGEESGVLSSPDSSGGLGVLAAGTAFNCVLCSEVLDTKEGVMEHWRSRHHCEQPSLLWDALSSYSGQEESEADGDGDLDTPAPSPHYPA
uniref:zinc finger protein 438 n=1 Tax=Scatophagus argus TaxID=75038 RepID=UPI001ED82C87|nr:zinc finger protein 438 [Scatophagus argus]XP_046227100.1 zinc finger protein 438 [Scatophagus argus]XP_046227101.1 zinc finger protein 438 [Scatophagus argus]XP_046227102.1 zinc finger protein 438 [Scatophagus argus]XP_046227103.1 zinc finger protein 438 [Scatophagus argus]XP_046227104.1 zinc finger protein 438 [Scatophagus argus]